MTIDEEHQLFHRLGYNRAGWTRWEQDAHSFVEFTNDDDVRQDIMQRVLDGELKLLVPGEELPTSKTEEPSLPDVPQSAPDLPGPMGYTGQDDDIPF